MQMGETYRRTNITATLHRSGLYGGVAKLNPLLSEDTWKHLKLARTLRLWETRCSGLMYLNSTQQEWFIHNAVNVFEWTSHSLGLNPIKYFWRNLKMCVCPHPTWQSLRGEEVRRRMADNCQMMMCKACHSIPKHTWGCKVASAKYWFKGLNTYAMYLIFIVFF